MKRNDFYSSFISLILIPLFIAIPNAPYVDLIDSDTLIERLEKRVKNFPQEKVYVHTDKPIYALGETIWMKTYLVNAATHLVNTPSSMVHIELLDPSGKIKKQLDIKVEDGWDHADILLDKTWATGSYTLRAYTSYMCNYDHDFIFQKSIMIGDAFQQIEDSPIKHKEAFISFFPEGGNLINGISTAVAFTAVNESGDPLKISGEIYDENGNMISPISTYENGYVWFELVPEKCLNYTLKLLHPLEKEFSLPSSLNKGLSLAVNSHNEEFHLISVRASMGESLDKAFVIAHQRGIPVALIDKFKGQSQVFKISKEEIPDGILHITLFNKDRIPVSERLVYNDHRSNDINIDVSIPYSYYGLRSKVDMTIEVTDTEGSPLGGNISVSVTDRYKVPQSEYGLNIENYLLMYSDLSSSDSEPGTYLINSAKNQYMQDLILMTHGWRRFRWDEIIDDSEPELLHPPKSGFDIVGSISKDKKPLKTDLTLSFISEDLQVLETKSDKSGVFNLFEVDIRDTTDIVVQANDKKNKKIKKADVSLQLENPISIKGDNVHSYSIDIESWSTYLNTALENARLDSFYQVDFTIDLEEVTVRSTRADLNRKLNKERNIPYREYDNRLLLDSMRFIQPYYTVFDIVRLSVPGVEVVGTPGVNQEFIIRGRSSFALPAGATVLVNGVPSSTGTVNALRAADIQFIDVLKGPAKTALYGRLGGTGVVAIYTKSGRTPPPRAKQIEGLFNMKHPGYYRAREFPKTDYSMVLPIHKKPDFRTTIHWEPSITMDESSRGKVAFYTGDRITSYRVDVQGVTSDGRPIQKITYFDVKEN